MNRQENIDLTRAHSEMMNAAPDSKDWRDMVKDVDTLRRIGKWLHRHAERLCSDEGYCKNLVKWVRIEERKEAHAIVIVAQYEDLAVAFSRDPRGRALIVYADDNMPYEYGRQHIVLAE